MSKEENTKKQHVGPAKTQMTIHLHVCAVSACKSMQPNQLTSFLPVL